MDIFELKLIFEINKKWWKVNCELLLQVANLRREYRSSFWIIALHDATCIESVPKRISPLCLFPVCDLRIIKPTFRKQSESNLASVKRIKTPF